MQKTLLVLFFLPACSYAFGGDGSGAAGGAGGSVGDTATVGPSTTGVTASASQSQAQSVTASTQESVSVTVEQSSSTGSVEPVDLPPCSAPWGFESQSDDWKEFADDVYLDQGGIYATVNNNGGRALFGLEPANLGDAPDCFVSIRVLSHSMTAVPRALLSKPDQSETVRIAFYPADQTIAVLHLADQRTWPAPEPQALGFARHAGQLYAGYKAGGVWSLVHVPSLPSWFDAATQDARQMFGVGEDWSRWVRMDDYGADPISTADIAGAVAWP